MSEAKHTKGPWLRDQYGQIKAGNQTIRVNGVSLPCGGKPDDFKEVEANSNLIAAAPELLEALQNLLNECGANGMSWTKATQNASAAIAKATGEQK